MSAQVDVLIKPIVLRFSLVDGAPVYYMSADPVARLDGVEALLGIDPRQRALFDCNLGFLPTCSTVLVRGRKNILVDPNGLHISAYGMLAGRLRVFGLTPADVDVVVNTHLHSDHCGGNVFFPDKTLYLGAGEVEAAARNEWHGYTRTFVHGLTDKVRTVERGDGPVELDEGVAVLHTPGHTPGSVCVLVETGSDRIAILGDSALTADEYVSRRLSHWYSPAQVEQINAALDEVAAWRPTRIIPGHDYPVQTDRGIRA